ncbi:ArsR family transcriptional regulator [Halomicroarcula limicola]|uniref:ArsR family transcriptional regulator n=1 Tax=Haloarcula limicola TaxID=1429915 RepID=A0A8J7Y0S7_9EURY|nr:ArsR family transcriptional regulator [Halomicroarcula limicola]MBV0922605.1 ArsR family transcriptional regulator [Halomicroarcula limicola]
MDATLDEIEFLALSSNRIAVLERLAAEKHTRSELAEATGASQATLGRILGDFEDRKWVRREGGGYVATATGTLVAEGFRDLVDVLDTERELRDIAEYLPTDAMDFDLRHLAGATITRPTQTRPNAPLQHLLTLMDGADEVTAFSHTLNDQSLRVAADRTGDQRFRAVLPQSAIDALVGDEALRDRLRDLVAAETASVRVYDGEIPLAVTIVDDVVNLLVRDRRGVLRAAVDSEHPAVRAWAETQFERYHADSTPLSAGSLSP